MQIALISVAPPYRGGISKHTSILAENISKTHSVDIMNYSRQYPMFLFPGKSQYMDEHIKDFPSHKSYHFKNNENHNLDIFENHYQTYIHYLVDVNKIVDLHFDYNIHFLHTMFDL